MYSLLLVLYYADVSVSIRINSLMIVPPNPIITAVYYVIQTNPLMITVYLGHQLLLLDIASSFHFIPLHSKYISRLDTRISG